MNAFTNSQELTGKTAIHNIDPSVEWCCEAYLKTDYNQLTEQDFIKVLRNYNIFKMMKDE